jgi:Family of unknown function (DUF5681)
MKFKPGQSGNPAGKPKGAKDRRTELRALLAPHAHELIDKVVALAKSGDTTALRILIDRLIPPIKARDEAVTVADLDGSVVNQGMTVLKALAAGEITPEQAATMISVVATQARITEVGELERRIESLEQAIKLPKT